GGVRRRPDGVDDQARRPGEGLRQAAPRPWRRAGPLRRPVPLRDRRLLRDDLAGGVASRAMDQALLAELCEAPGAPGREVRGREELLGVMGSKPVHIMSEEERKRAPRLEDYFVDVGLPGERVRELVRPGDRVIRERTLARLGDLVTCKSLDNRAGLYVMIEAARALADH